MGCAIVVANYLTLANYVACVEFVFVDYVVLVDDVMLVFYNVLVFNNLLRSRAIKNLLHDRFRAALRAAIYAIAIHKHSPL